MTRTIRGSLTVRLVALGLAQLAVLAAVALVIAWLTRPAGPDHDHHHGPPPPHHAAPRHDAPHGLTSPDGLLGGPALTLWAGVLVIGLGALLTARWIVTPLRHLASTARDVGRGDLSIRTGLDRGDEIGEVARAFDAMLERIAEQRAAERELLANVSHELRTPMARIRVATELASEGDADATREALADIATDLAELEVIVSDILMASRLDVAARGGASPLRPAALRSMSALDVAHEAERRFRTRHPDRALTVEGEDATVEVDPVLFRRVLDNLLENARKYSPDVESPIELRVERVGDDVVFEVSDHGIGIGAEDLARVFEPFFRAERSRVRDAGGVGLGLTLVQRIVEAHGGAVAIESELGEGTRVSVRIPI